MSYAGIDIGFGYTKMSFNGKNFYFKTVVSLTFILTRFLMKIFR